jgi:glycosyltransferase involved in cell wall biosynthesis
MTSHVRVLYVDTYTIPEPGATAAISSSDAIGYGITSSGTIRRELGERGIDVELLRIPVPPETAPERRRVRWTAAIYSTLVQALDVRMPDVIFVFHAFVVSPAEIRRLLFDLGLRIPIVGYTHGSHWDETDTFRTEAYPGLELLDLANLLAMDRVLVVSAYLRQTLADSVGRLNPSVARRLAARVRCVGLPLDTETIDRYRPDKPPAKQTVVFNHAPIGSKNPDVFARAMLDVLDRTDVDLLFTRCFPSGAPGASGIAELRRRFGERVRLGGDMSTADYYRALWRATIQVSTASHESLGMATLEAMYTENCCVLPRLGSYPDLCGDNPEVLYEPGDEAELVRRVIEFGKDDARRRRIATQLSDRARDYRGARVVDAIVEVIGEVLT